MYIDYGTKIIHVLQSDLTFVSGTLYELDTDWFRLQLKSFEDNEEGMAHLRTHRHNTEVTLLGTTFARVLEIINGYSITFEDLPYTVKLVGSNNNFFDVDGGILNRNQVQVVSTNSAGLIASTADRQISEDVNFASGVYLDTSSGRTGTVYPNGTRTFPVDNLTDALSIASTRATSTINLAGTLTLDQNVSGKEIISWKNGKVDLNNQTAIATRFRNLEVYGIQSDISLFYNCRVKNLQGLSGVYDGCSFMYDSAYEVQGNTSVSFLDCVSNISGGHMVLLDCANDSIELEFRNISMGLTIINWNHADNIAELGFDSGELELDVTCTAGTIYAGGVFDLTDNSSVGCSVNTDGKAATVKTIWDELKTDHTIAGSFGNELATKGDISGGISVTAETDPVVKLAAILSL